MKISKIIFVLISCVMPITVKASDLLKSVIPDQYINLKSDKMEGMNWVECKAPDFNKTPNLFTIYFGISETNSITPMHLIVRYHGDDWLFVENIWGRVDGDRFEIKSFNRGGEWQRDNGYGKVWEWKDREIDNTEDVEFIKKISNSKETTIRFEGAQYKYDRKLTLAEINCLKKMIAKYEFATGVKW